MLTRWQRHAEAHPRAADAAVALLLFGVSFSGSMLSTTEPSDRPTWWTGVLISAVSCTSLLWQRGRPRTVVAVTTVCAMGTSAMGFLLTPLLLGPVMSALYWLAAGADRKTTRRYTLGVAVLVGATALFADPVNHSLLLKTLNPIAWVLLSAMFGSGVQLRRAYLEALQARAAHAERLRIARELHDVVAHHLTLANAQAGTAAHLARTHPDQAQRILTDLTGTTASALRELKATVGLLRQANDTETPLEPSPGLARLDDLTASFASTGLTVTVTTQGEPRELSAAVDLTAFRIVQEALTNVSKHAATKTAYVHLAHAPDGLTLKITDDGRPTAPTVPAAGHGFGLIGMRERAHSVGGHLHAGHRPEGGFEVVAELPSHPRNPEENSAP
ncbi:histidine kinase [Streptomyces durmitorensis]|uniref:histidine kinase n=1 Tax=Streptomyces durmitorensis TaxID=319947 RepID=A0ABY4PMT3_9ACTN|nr:sensor histidine kinase [Streptomyces durmitorensis]UQT55133.1 sensor histidine kinase [Streptomyces durmitorensis]